jgi:hypothetical protein
MAAYKNVIFEVDESREKFDTTTFYHTTWESIVLSKGVAEGHYLVTLRKGIKTMKADVYPVFAGKSYEEARNVYDQKFAAYQAALDNRRSAESAARIKYENTLMHLGLTQAAVQIEQQKAHADTDAASQVMRVFTISSFGVYNCDSPGNFPSGANCIVNVKDEDGNPLTGLTNVYHVDRNLFGLYGYFAAATGKISPLKFNPSSSNLVWGVKEGVLYMADDDQFGVLSQQPEADLRMKRIDHTFKTAEEMRVFLRVPVRI